MEIVSNPLLKLNFDETQRQFENKGIPSHSIYVYHGTASQNVTSILVNNFDKKKIKCNALLSPACHRHHSQKLILDWFKAYNRI